MKKILCFLVGAFVVGLLIKIYIFPNHQPTPSAQGISRNGSTAVKAELPIAKALGKSGTNNNSSAMETKESLEQWRAYQAGTVPFEQLSEANQKRVNQSKYLKWEIEDRERREKIQAMDIANGLNADVRKREAELRKQSENLYKGMEQSKLLALLGDPSMKSSPTNFLPPQRIADADAVLIFSPHPKGRISYSMGDSFQYLEIWVNSTNQTLYGWRWKTPGMMSYYH